MNHEPKNHSSSMGPLRPLQRLYDARRNGLGVLNTRNRLTMIFTFIIVAILASAFANRSESIDHWRSFVQQNPDIKILDPRNFRIEVSTPLAVTCLSDCLAEGPPTALATAPKASTLFELNKIPTRPETHGTSKARGIWTVLHFHIPAAYLKSRGVEGGNLALGLPAFRYRSASVEVNGLTWQRHLDSERIIIRSSKMLFYDADLTVTVTALLPETGVIYDALPVYMPPYLSSVSQSRNLEKFLQHDRDTRGIIISVMSRILIAFFALFIFMVIDSTPESFGLAMFLGCEAVAIVIGQGWLNVPGSKMVLHTFYQMGDIFRLYFFIQISRMFKPHTRYWLLGATLLSVPYGYFRFMETKWGLTGLDMIPRFRDFGVGSIGGVLCLMALFSIRSEKLPWRKAALILAAACSFQQILGPLLYVYPEWDNSPAFRHFFTSYATLSSYLGALSALTNISTLENRVSRLSQARAHGEMMENELALGQTVQRSFMTMPDLPTDFEMAQVHEAAVYVSGDIFYMDWNESENRLVLLMCDVTGHGVQAALKATACYMLARNIWSHDVKSMSGSTPEERFDRFRREQDDLMALFSDTPDIPTFSCLEVYPSRSTFYSYRTNFNAPLIVEPNPYGGWALRSEAMRDGVTKDYPLKPGCLLVLFSDGYIGSSRHLMRLTRFIDSRLASFDGSPGALKDFICEFDRKNPDRPDDDRTMVVLSWKRPMAKHARQLAAVYIDKSA